MAKSNGNGNGKAQKGHGPGKQIKPGANTKGFGPAKKNGK